MPEEDALNTEERETLAAVARFKPATIRLNPFRIRSEAQRRRAKRQVWLWRGIAAALAAGLIVSWIWRPGSAIREHVVYVRLPAPAIAPETALPRSATTEIEPRMTPPLGDDYLAVRDRVLAFGIDALRPHGPAVRHYNPLPIPDASPWHAMDILGGGSL
ncbi:MAG TPA: hypothetical protein VG274_04280 [Rhizomicrobium sp.]|jgi:hypothetical protein|nr:hypothetical protein [Rhizomicrobium sp.]